MKRSAPADSASECSILFVGPLPPPLHGAAAINRKVVDALSEYLTTRVCDQSPKDLFRGPGYYFRRLYNVILALFMIFRNSARKNPKLYMSLDGGLGSLFNIAVIAASRLSMHKLTLHHHSFAYINHRSSIFAVLTRIAGPKAMHVCLCKRMERKLMKLYPSICRSMVVPNFIDSEHSPADLGPIFSGPDITVGHMSNLSVEKGLLEFFALIRNGITGRKRLKGVLAGPPASKEAGRLIESAMNEFGCALDYRGPVYNDEKGRFFRDIDAFIFPTQYSNEAQPVVVAEAMSYGLPVISYDRGCIRDALKGYMSLVIDQQDDFVRQSITALDNWSKCNPTRNNREYNLDHYREVRAHHRQRWEEFVIYLLS